MPPQIDDIGLGFRVPLLTISPYTRRGVIDDEVGEFSTPLRFISDNWGLKPLTPRIAKTHNIEHLFDFSGRDRAHPCPAARRRRPTPRTRSRTRAEGYPGWPEGTEPEAFIT